MPPAMARAMIAVVIAAPISASVQSKLELCDASATTEPPAALCTEIWKTRVDGTVPPFALRVGHGWPTRCMLGEGQGCPTGCMLGAPAATTTDGVVLCFP
jgi:hypothetical protein